MVHAVAQTPATQKGSADVQSALDVHVLFGFVGWQAPLVHVNPALHRDDALQPGRHCPLSHTSPAAHWFDDLHTLVAAWHEPVTHWSPLEQSAVVVHGQGPFVPPQVTQAFS
jgi:hypothetical protein